MVALEDQVALGYLVAERCDDLALDDRFPALLEPRHVGDHQPQHDGDGQREESEQPGLERVAHAVVSDGDSEAVAGRGSSPGVPSSWTTSGYTKGGLENIGTNNHRFLVELGTETAADYLTLHDIHSDQTSSMAPATMLDSGDNWRTVEIGGSLPAVAAFSRNGQCYTSWSATIATLARLRMIRSTSPIASTLPNK